MSFGPSRKPVLLRGHPTLTMTFESTYFGGVSYTPPAKMPGEGALYGHQKRSFLKRRENQYVLKVDTIALGLAEIISTLI